MIMWRWVVEGRGRAGGAFMGVRIWKEYGWVILQLGRLLEASCHCLSLIFCRKWMRWGRGGGDGGGFEVGMLKLWSGRLNLPNWFSKMDLFLVKAVRFWQRLVIWDIWLSYEVPPTYHIILYTMSRSPCKPFACVFSFGAAGGVGFRPTSKNQINVYIV